MAKSLQEILGLIQDPTAKADLEAQIADFNAKQTRLQALESQLNNNELVDKSIVAGWREFEAKKKPAIEAELARLQTEVAALKPEAERAKALEAQIGSDSTVVDPAKILPSIEAGLRGKFLTPEEVDTRIKAAVERATYGVTQGSIPQAVKIVHGTMRAKSEFGLDIDPDTFAEAVTRFGGTDQAYAALTADAARAKADADRAAQAAAHAAAIEAARQEGLRLGRQEADTRNYSPEEGGGSGVIPMVPPQDKPELSGVNPQSYNPNDGTLAREANKMLQKQEADGLWGGQRVM